MAFIGNGAQLTDLDAADIASGTLPLARGGTGTTNTVNTVVAGSGISVSTSGTQVTVSSSGGGVTSLNGQTGAITNTNVDSIGSYMPAIYAVTGSGGIVTTQVNTTIAGSSLRYNYNGAFSIDSLTSSSSSGFTAGGSSLSGTWRAMNTSRVVYNPGGGYQPAFWTWTPALWVRIS
jgi:hypothetical protein